MAVIVIAIQIFTEKIETIILYVLYDGITTILFANRVSFLTYCVLRRTELKKRDFFYITFYSSINVLFVFLLWYYTMILYLLFYEAYRAIMRAYSIYYKDTPFGAFKQFINM